MIDLSMVGAVLSAVGPIALLITFLLDVGGRRERFKQVLAALEQQDRVNKDFSAQLKNLGDQQAQTIVATKENAVRVEILEGMYDRIQTGKAPRRVRG